MKIKKLDKNTTQWLPRNLMSIPIGFAPSKKAYKRLMKAYNVKGPEAAYPASHACFFSLTNGKTGQRFGVIVLRPEIRGRSKCALYALLAHEVYHCFNWLMTVIKEEKPSEELGAYFFQSLLQDTLEAYEATK